MNKKIITFAIAAIGLCGISASAQTAADNQTCNNQNKEQCVDNKMYKPQKFTDFAFEGILLDINQQAAIDKINEQYKDQLAPRGPRGPRDQKCDSAKCDKSKAQCDKKGAKCDKSKAQCDKAAAKSSPDRKGWLRQYSEQVKEVLTPDQYVTYLENIVFSTPDRQGFGPGHQGKKFDKDRRGGHHAKADRKMGSRARNQQELKAQGTANQSM